MVPITIRPGIAAALDRHERRREEGAPCVSILVGDPGLALCALRQWAEGRNRMVIQGVGPGIEALSEEWLASLAQRRGLVTEVASKLSLASGQSAEELAGLISRASLFDLERLLETYLPGEMADLCRWVLKVPEVRGKGSLDRLPAVLTGLLPEHAMPVCFAAMDPESPNAEWFEAAASALARLAEVAPRLTLMLAVDPLVFERYLRESPDSRSRTLLRAGVIPITAGTLEPLIEGVSDCLKRLDEPIARPASDRTLDGRFDHDVAVSDVFGVEEDGQARSAAERLLHDRLESLSTTSGLFTLNAILTIPFGTGRTMEVDLWAERLGLAVEIDGYYHFQDGEAYRRDRRKDFALQKHGHLVVRVLAEDVMERLEDVLDVVLDAVAVRRDRLNSSRGKTS